MAVVAVDIGKSSLDVSVSEGPVLRFDNTAKGITKLLKHLTKQEATLAVCESTGGYERLLVSRLRKAEIGVRVANPGRVRAFAKACGYEAKTDPRDAQVLSRMDRYSLNPTRRQPIRNARSCRICCGDAGSWLSSEYRKRTGWTASAAVVESTKRHIAWLDAGLPSWRRSTCRAAPPWPSGQRCTGPCPAWDRSPRPHWWPFCPNWVGGTARP